MQNSSLPLNRPKATLRPARALFRLLLRTALWTAVILACGLYCFKEVALPGFSRPRSAQQSINAAVPLPAAESRTRPAAGRFRTAATDPLALIKPAALPAESGEEGAARRPARPAAAGIPRMKTMGFGESGGGFAPMRTAAAGAARPARARAAAAADSGGEEGVILPAAALSGKIGMKGSAPVSAAAEKRYSGADKEAEALRAAVRARTEASEALKKRLRNEQLILAGWILLAATGLMLTASRLIRAWRQLDKPEGKHWTLK
ncbi:MAG TPA: hypothetical protein PKI19_04360 [Elusimicrobiales bacterium]|nr:hypothetical protein [Elusimicrobiales bacterium]